MVPLLPRSHIFSVDPRALDPVLHHADIPDYDPHPILENLYQWQFDDIDLESFLQERILRVIRPRGSNQPTVPILPVDVFHCTRLKVTYRMMKLSTMMLGDDLRHIMLSIIDSLLWKN